MPTDRYAVFGNPVGHSQSPRIHTLFARQTGQDMSYEAILAPLDGFEPAVCKFVGSGGRGANVTVPFKEEAFKKIATLISPRARAARAVNTLSFDYEEENIGGDNTDGVGLVRDIRDNLAYPLPGRRILLLGAGGAARGVILPLLQEQPAELMIVNRTAKKAVRLVAEFAKFPGCPFKDRLHTCRYGDLPSRAFDVVINATSAGLDDAALPIPATIFAPGGLAYDMVYGRETPFMALARTVPGVRIADGLGMLVEQAAEAFYLWRGIRPQTAPVLAELGK